MDLQTRGRVFTYAGIGKRTIKCRDADELLQRAGRQGLWGYEMSGSAAGKRSSISKCGFADEESARAALQQRVAEVAEMPKTLRKHPKLRLSGAARRDLRSALQPAASAVCAICARPERRMHGGRRDDLSIDHNHVTGEVRGLLCAGCNTLLGLAEENVAILARAITYLSEHSS